MDTLNIRGKLHDYVDNGDDRLLELMYTLAQEYSHSTEASFFTKEDISIFEERRKRRITGESKVYNWADAKAIITGKRNLA